MIHASCHEISDVVASNFDDIQFQFLLDVWYILTALPRSYVATLECLRIAEPGCFTILDSLFWTKIFGSHFLEKKVWHQHENLPYVLSWAYFSALWTLLRRWFHFVTFFSKIKWLKFPLVLMFFQLFSFRKTLLKNKNSIFEKIAVLSFWGFRVFVSPWAVVGAF